MTYISPPSINSANNNDKTWSECRSIYMVELMINWFYKPATGSAFINKLDVHMEYIEAHGCVVDEQLNPDDPQHPPIYDHWNHPNANNNIIRPPNVAGSVGSVDRNGNYRLALIEQFIVQVPCNKPCVVDGMTIATETKSWTKSNMRAEYQLNYMWQDVWKDMGSWKTRPELDRPFRDLFSCFSRNALAGPDINWGQGQIDRVNNCWKTEMGKINDMLKALPNCDIANEYCPENIQPDFSNFDSFNYRGQNERRMLERGFDSVVTSKVHPKFLQIQEKQAQLRGELP